MQGVKISRDDLERKRRELIDLEPALAQFSEEWNKEYEFRKKLVLARQEAGIKQKDIESQTGLAQRAISRLETDMDVSPNIKTLIKYLMSIGYELDIVKMKAHN